MKLIDTPYKIRCEMGVCKNYAAKSVVFDRVGIKSHLHVCPDCLKALYGLIGATLIPQSIETVGKKSRQKRLKDEAAV